MYSLGASLLAITLQVSAPAATAGTSYSPQVITAEQLAQAGVVRLGDVFALADGWTYHSTNGYTVDAALIGTAPWDVPAWKLFVDSVRMDLRQLGHQDINSVPITIPEICSVELHSEPVFIDGEYAGSGAVHIHLCTPPGAAAKVMAAAGSVTGDPGPFKYTPLGAANVDRSGPHVQSVLSVTGRAWHARLQGRIDEHHSTDPRIRERARTLYVGEKDARVFHRSVYADLAHRQTESVHRFYAGVVRFEDLSYYELMALEVPVDHTLLHIGAAASRQLPRGWHVVVQLRSDRNILRTRPNPRNVRLDRRQASYRAFARARRAYGTREAEIGLGGGHAGIAGVESTAYGRLGLRLASRWRIVGELQTTYVRRALGFVFSTALHRQPVGRQHFQVRFTGEQQQIAIQRPLWYWIREGFDHGRFAGSTFDLPPAPRSIKLHADWGMLTASGLQFTLAAAYNLFWNVAVTSHCAVYDPSTTGLLVDPVLRAGRGGLATVSARLRAAPFGVVQLFLHGTFGYKHSPDPHFIQGARRHPNRSGSLTARVQPMPRMTVFGRFSMAGPSEWVMYRDAALAAPDHYASTLPSTYVMDLTIQKRFWLNHVRLGASLRNMLNRAYPTHPGGPVSGLAVQFYLYANT